MSEITDNAMLIAAVAAAALVWRNWSAVIAKLPKLPTRDAKPASEWGHLEEDYRAIEALEARAMRLPNREIAKACKKIREQFLVVDPPGESPVETG